MKRILLISIIVLLVSCNAKHCITYNSEKYGSMEYCFDSTKSNVEGTDVFSNKEDSVAIIETSLLDKIENFIKDKLGVRSTKKEASEKQKTKYERIKDFFFEQNLNQEENADENGS
jgi:hypothetical protein